MQYLLEEAQLAEEVGSKSESQTSDLGVKSLSCKFLFFVKRFACHFIAFTVLLSTADLHLQEFLHIVIGRHSWGVERVVVYIK